MAENNSSKLTHYLIASSSSCVGKNGGEASDDECVLVSMMVDGLSMSSISFFYESCPRSRLWIRRSGGYTKVQGVSNCYDTA